MQSAWSVYLLRCGDGSLYAGVARDVGARLEKHERGRGARYTRGRGPLSLVLVEPAASHGDALRREAAIRRLSRAGKEVLIASRPPPAELPARAPSRVRRRSARPSPA